MKPKILHTWKTLSLVQENKLLPNGKQIEHTTLHHPGAVVILPVDHDGRIILLRQYRPSVNDWIYELPAGTMEAGEDASECAERELAEETNFSAECWQSLGEILPAPGFCNETQFLFCASGLSETTGELDEDEVLEVERIKPSDIEILIKNNKINDAKTIVTFYKAKLMGLIYPNHLKVRHSE